MNDKVRKSALHRENNYILYRKMTHKKTILVLFINSNMNCVTNDNGYVPLVVNTSRSFPHSWLITGFVTRLTWRVPLVEQELYINNWRLFFKIRMYPRRWFLFMLYWGLKTALTAPCPLNNFFQCDFTWNI